MCDILSDIAKSLTKRISTGQYLFELNIWKLMKINGYSICFYLYRRSTTEGYIFSLLVHTRIPRLLPDSLPSLWPHVLSRGYPNLFVPGPFPDSSPYPFLGGTPVLSQILLRYPQNRGISHGLGLSTPSWLRLGYPPPHHPAGTRVPLRSRLEGTPAPRTGYAAGGTSLSCCCVYF